MYESYISCGEMTADCILLEKKPFIDIRKMEPPFIRNTVEMLNVQCSTS